MTMVGRALPPELEQGSLGQAQGPGPARPPARARGRRATACTEEEGKRSVTISTRRLRRLWRLGALIPGSKWPLPKQAHFLHSLPLLGFDDHDEFGNEDVVLKSAAREEMVSGLDVRHRDGVAAFTQ